MSKKIAYLLVLLMCSFGAFARNEGILFYKKDIYASADKKKQHHEQMRRYQHAENIWDTMRQHFLMPHYEDLPKVREKIIWYLNNQEVLLRAASRAAPYLYFILQEIRERQLPAELALIPIIESGYNPFAISNRGASGLWQMMPDTATGLGIAQNHLYDGRRDIVTSTHAALNHLIYLQNFFDGNWLLALSAYNTGEGNVLAAIKRNIKAGKRTDFWSLPLAQQTKDYVPSILALAAIIERPEVYQIYLPPVKNAPYLAQIDIGRQINLKYAAKLAGMDIRKMLVLNPGYNQYLTTSKGPFKLILPIQNVIQFSQNFAKSRLSLKLNWLRYRVQPNDTIASISKKFNVAENKILDANAHSSTLKPDMILFIPDEKNDLSPKILKPSLLVNKFKKSAKQTKLTFKPLQKTVKSASVNYILMPGDTVYMIRKHDTIEKIAEKFHVPISDIASINSISASTVKEGKQIIVPTHQKKGKPSKNYLLRPSDTIHVVAKGDTFAGLAEKYQTSEAKIRLLNLKTNRELKEGERLVIPEPMDKI